MANGYIMSVSNHEKGSVEAYALSRKRYHPIILKKMLELRANNPGIFQGLFSSNKDIVLFFNALKTARVHILNRKRIASGRRAPDNRKNPCIEYRRQYPIAFARLFSSQKDAISLLKFEIAREDARKDNRQASAIVSSGDERKAGDTPCFMLGNHAIWARNVLNKPGRHVGNTFDLSTIEGFVYFLHEVLHVMQWFRSPLVLLFQYVKAVVKSLALSEGHITWAHELIDFEVEAIVFQERLWAFLESWNETEEFLQEFENLH